MTDHDEAGAVRPLTLAWVGRHLTAGERIVRTEALHGGITAEMRRLTVATQDGGVRHLVLRTFVNPSFADYAEEMLNREANVLTLLAGTGVTAPGPVEVDPTAERCEYPSLLMTHLVGRTVLEDEGLEARVPLLARQLVAVHAVRPAERPQEYKAWTIADAIVPPPGADAAVWAAAIDVIRKPAPPYEGRFLHRDFHPGNVLFEVEQASAAGPRITGVVDWVQTSWGPVDLDVAAPPISRSCTIRRGVCGSPRRMKGPAGRCPRPRASGCTGSCSTHWRARGVCGGWHGRGGKRGGRS